MKRITHIALCLILFSTSCKKKVNDVHFHGRVTVGCNSQVPVKNQQISIFREFDTGSYQSEKVGTAVTDNNGYYSFFADVDQSGSFRHYLLNESGGYTLLLDQNAICFGITGDNSADVELNATAILAKAHGFHIKNVTPFNTADNLNSLVIWDLLGTYDYDTIISNLNGENVDTVIYRFFTGDPPVYCKYSYTKNGFPKSSVDSLSSPNCLDTLTANIFY